MLWSDLFQRFVDERRYLKNVSPKTVEWYTYSFRAFAPALDGVEPDAVRPAGKRAIAEMARRMAPASVNDYIRALNAFLRWAHEEQLVPVLVRFDFLREPQKVIQTLSEEHVKRILSWKPSTWYDVRLQTLMALLLDTGVRIDEALTLRRDGLDMDAMTLKVVGKGRKERQVPFSPAMRGRLHRYLRTTDHPVLFCAKSGAGLQQRNLLRAFHRLAGELQITGVRFSPHTFRHTFAVNYLKRGGNVFYLQRILGHTTLEMTNRYVRSLGIDDLRSVHSGLTLLGT